MSKMKKRSHSINTGLLDRAVMEAQLEATVTKREPRSDGALWRAPKDDFPALRRVVQSCRIIDPDDDPEDFEVWEVLAKSKIGTKQLWLCSADGGDAWTLHELRVKRRGYLVFTLYGD